MDQVSQLLAHPLSSWASADSYTLDQDIIASRQALQHTAKAIGTETSFRSNSRRAENMARYHQHQYQQQHHQGDHGMQLASTRPELHQSAFISAAALPGDAPSPYVAPYLAGSHYTGGFEQTNVSSTLEDLHHQQQQLPTAYYTTASTYNTLPAVTTQAQEPCYASYPVSSTSSIQLPSINTTAMYGGIQYSTNNYGYGLHQEPAYYGADERDMMYETESRPFFDYQGCMDGYSAPPLMVADQTAFSTPDMLMSQRFPEPKTPPPPATAAAKGFDPVASESDDDLVGVGLYDEPMSSSFLEEPMSAFNSRQYVRAGEGMGKGLKLEETFDPSTLEMKFDDEEEEGEEKKEARQ